MKCDESPVLIFCGKLVSCVEQQSVRRPMRRESINRFLFCIATGCFFSVAAIFRRLNFKFLYRIIITIRPAEIISAPIVDMNSCRPKLSRTFFSNASKFSPKISALTCLGKRTTHHCAFVSNPTRSTPASRAMSMTSATYSKSTSSSPRTNAIRSARILKMSCSRLCKSSHFTAS